MQEVDDEEDEKEPGEHGVHERALEEEYVPAGHDEHDETLKSNAGIPLMF